MKQTCKRCNGTGLEPDQSKIGNQMRAMRESSGLSLRGVADKLKISAAYLSDMELGRRAWSSARIRQFVEVVK